MQVLKNTSDLMRQKFLNESVSFMRHCIEGGGAYPFEVIYNEMDHLRVTFKAATHRFTTTNAEWLTATSAKNEMAADLGKTVRHFLQTAERRSVRLEHPKHIVNRFRDVLNQGRFPAARNLTAWGIVAQELVWEDQRMVEEGYPAMDNPSAADLQYFLDREEELGTDQTHKGSLFTQAREDMALLREQVDHLTRVLYYYLRGWSLHLPPSTAREFMRNFGYRFAAARSKKKKKTSEEDQPESPNP